MTDAQDQNPEISKPSIDLVDPFIGVDGPGNTLCGPYTPLGLVRLGPDCVPPHPTNGYNSDQALQGFSHTHVSGTGGEGRFGNVRLTPFVGEPTTEPPTFSRRNEHSRVGLYQVCLEPGSIDVELTSSPRCGISRFQFPQGCDAHALRSWCSPFCDDVMFVIDHKCWSQYNGLRNVHHRPHCHVGYCVSHCCASSNTPIRVRGSHA